MNEEMILQQSTSCEYCGCLVLNKNCSLCLSDSSSFKDGSMLWINKLREIRREIKLHIKDREACSLDSQLESFMELLSNDIHSFDKFSKNDKKIFEPNYFQKLKNHEKEIIESLSFMEYCKIEVLKRMFCKASAIISYSVDPREDYFALKNKMGMEMILGMNNMVSKHKKEKQTMEDKIKDLQSKIHSLKIEISTMET